MQFSFHLPLDTSGVKEILLLMLLLPSPSESPPCEPEGYNNVSVRIYYLQEKSPKKLWRCIKYTLKQNTMICKSFLTHSGGK